MNITYLYMNATIVGYNYKTDTLIIYPAELITTIIGIIFCVITIIKVLEVTKV